MELMLVSSIPVVILMLFSKMLPRKAKPWLYLASIPFVVLLAFYSILIGLGLVVAFLIIAKVRAYKLNNADHTDSDNTQNEKKIYYHPGN